MSSSSLTRRNLVGLLAAGSLSGCATTDSSRTASSSATPSSGTPVPARPGSPTPSDAPVQTNAAFQRLEAHFEARLGVWAVDTSTRRELRYRANERFAFCSTGKAVLAAKVLASHTSSEMNQLVRYTQSDLIAHSPITTEHVAIGMTIRQLCDAAVRYSDNAAANLLYARIGTPAALQQFVRSIGDNVTNMNRTGPDLSLAVPNDPRDTTTPAGWGTDFQQLLLGNVLSRNQRQTLTNWMVKNTTGATMIRASVPAGWMVADKTGTGWYGTRNDIGVIWPRMKKTIVIALMSSRANHDDSINDDLIAQATTTVLSSFHFSSSSNG